VIGFVLRMAGREIRAAPRRLLLLTGSVAIGVAALVAIGSFADNVRDSVRGQARGLLGADFALSSRRPLPPAAERILDSLRARGGTVARLTNFGGMAYVPRTSGTRLVQVAAVEPGYPFYGDLRTEPAVAWGWIRHSSPRSARTWATRWRWARLGWPSLAWSPTRRPTSVSVPRWVLASTSPPATSQRPGC
jgi:putative ABC transport system permease protein